MSVLQQKKIAALELQIKKLTQANSSLRGELKRRPTLSTLHTSGHKFDFTEDQVRVTTATPTEYPFTEYGKTAILTPSAVEDEQRNKIANLAEKFIGLSMILSILSIVCGAISIIPVIGRHV